MEKLDQKKIQSSCKEEPENYTKLRTEIKSLMIQIKQVQKRLKAVCDEPVISEQFSERSGDMKGVLSQTIWTLGEMYGYTLADDVNEGTLE